jgi:hypothetical protein
LQFGTGLGLRPLLREEVNRVWPADSRLGKDRTDRADKKATPRGQDFCRLDLSRQCAPSFTPRVGFCQSKRKIRDRSGAVHDGILNRILVSRQFLHMIGQIEIEHIGGDPAAGIDRRPPLADRID